MFEFAGDWERPINYIFLAVTAVIAIHGIRWRDEDGKPDTVRLLFGCVAGLFFILVLLQDVLKVVRFS